MIYHYASWSFGVQPASSFLGRVGIYGVAIFYILSGQTLSYVYSAKLQPYSASLWDFYKKRVYRIFPLLWLATFISILLSKHVPNGLDIFLNITGLFGLVKWDVYFATGAWSIGNELFFYLTFPLLIFFSKKSRWMFWLIGTLTIATSYYFAFYRLHSDQQLSSQWHVYTNPLNQLIFFIGGMVIGRFVEPRSESAVKCLFSGILGLAILIFLPIQGNAIELVTGPNRFVLAASCFLLCYSFFGITKAISLVNTPLALLGQASYSLYLLHPIVYAVINGISKLIARTTFDHSLTLIFILSCLFSLFLSYLSHRYFEQFFIMLSHRRIRRFEAG